MARMIAILSLLLVAAATSPSHQPQALKTYPSAHQPNGSPTTTSRIGELDGAKRPASHSDYYKYNYYHPATKSGSPPVWFQIASTIILLLFTAGLWLTSIWQWKSVSKQAELANKTLMLQFRPRLVVRHVGLLTEPDEMLVPDEKGALKAVPVEIVVLVSNEGGSAVEIIEKNITSYVLDGPNGLREALQQRGSLSLLPPFDKRTGLPAYGTDSESLLDKILKAGESRIISRVMPIPDSVQQQVRIYLATHPYRSVKSMHLIVFGYFKYRDEMETIYTTAFCRRYDRGEGKFVSIDNEAYEYRT